MVILKMCYGQQTEYIQFHSSQYRHQIHLENWHFWIYTLVSTKTGKLIVGWYQKPTDSDTILNFRSCAPLQYRRSVIKVIVHRVFRSTSTWEDYDKAMETNRKQ